jgi:hypothetical protein
MNFECCASLHFKCLCGQLDTVLRATGLAAMAPHIQRRIIPLP